MKLSALKHPSIAALLLFAHNTSALVYDVTSSACSGPGSFQEAVGFANVNPGEDTVSFQVDVNDVKDSTCNLVGADPGLAYMSVVPYDLVIEGNGHSIMGGSLYVTNDGLTNVPGLCPKDPDVQAIISSNPVGFIRLEAGVKVTVNDLKLKSLRAIAELRTDADLTLNSVTAERTFDFYRDCNTPAIFLSAGANQNVTINDSVFSEAWNDGLVVEGNPDGSQFWLNAFIAGESDAGTLSISNSYFGFFSGIPVIDWGGTAVNIETAEFKDTGFLNIRNGDAHVVNSLFTGNIIGQDLHQRIMASAGGSITLEASTVAVGLLDCPSKCLITTGPGLIIASNSASIELKASAVNVGLVDGTDNFNVLIREENGGDVSATTVPNPNWIQPVAAQDAAALQTILGQPALLTAAPGLPQDTAGASFRYEAITPLPDDGGGTLGLLIDAVTDADTTNVLTSPIDSSEITEDIFGNPRTEAGGTVRNIGAVQLGLAPTLQLTATGHELVGLNWTRPLDPVSGAITGYEVCFDTGTVPDPSTLGTDCKDGDGNLGMLETISNAPDTLSGQVNGLTNGDTYWFLVRGVNSSGGGPWSNVVTATPLGAIAAPSVTAAPSVCQVHLTWTEPDAGGETIDHYNVSYRLVGDMDWTLAAPLVVDLEYNVTGLTAETDYEFGVRAVTTTGASGDQGIVQTTTKKAGDLDGSGTVTYSGDRPPFLTAYGSSAGDANYKPDADLDCDGRVTPKDYRSWYAAWVADGRTR